MNSKLSPALVSVPSGILQISQLPGGFDNGKEEGDIAFSLVLPTYQESQNIQAIIRILSQLLDRVLSEKYELIVVDDDSPDLTWKLALELTDDYPQLRVLHRVREKGLATAVVRGWQVARGRFLGVIDADLQHPPEILLQLLQEMERGADLAVASRHVEGGGVSEWSLMRRFLSRGAQTLGLMLLPEVIGRLSDPMSGYFIVRRSAIAGKILSPVGYKIAIEIVARGEIDWIAEVGYVFQERQRGESKVTAKQYLEYLQHLLALRLSLWQIKRLFRFCLVGFSGVFVDMGMLFLLSDPSSLGLPLTPSKIVAAELAILNNFLWNDRWTFGDIARRQPGQRQRFQRFIKFNAVCLAGLVLNVLLLNFFFRLLGNRYLANFIAIALVTIWNFWFNLKLSWRVTDTKL